MSQQVLLVEDEPQLAASLRHYLEEEGLCVSAAAAMSEARQKLGPETDCVVLDWRLPDGQGIELVREWRARGLLTPIILLTARAELVDKVLALEMGANDYLTKPFEPRELLARIRVQLRSSMPGTREERPLCRAGIRLDTKSREVFFRGALVTLTKLEFDLLRLFLESPDQVFSRDELLNRIWGYDAYPTTRTVDNHVLALRQKFGAERFVTVRGIGYRFREPEILRGADEERAMR